MSTKQNWTIPPHKKIQQVSENILRVEGSLLSGPPLQRVMTVVKMTNGDLIIHSAIAMDEDSMKSLEAFGKPKYLIVPNKWHRLDAPLYLKRYPQLTVLCPYGAKKNVEKIVTVHGTYSDFPKNDRVQLETLEGVDGAEGVLIVKEDTGTTLVFNDALFNMPHLTGLKGFILRYITGSSGGPRISRIFKAALIKNKSALKKHFHKLAENPDLKRIIVSHHEMIENNPQQALLEAAKTI